MIKGRGSPKRKREKKTANRNGPKGLTGEAERKVRGVKERTETQEVTGGFKLCVKYVRVYYVCDCF